MQADLNLKMLIFTVQAPRYQRGLSQPCPVLDSSDLSFRNLSEAHSQNLTFVHRLTKDPLRITGGLGAKSRRPWEEGLRYPLPLVLQSAIVNRKSSMAGALQGAGERAARQLPNHS